MRKLESCSQAREFASSDSAAPAQSSVGTPIKEELGDRHPRSWGTVTVIGGVCLWAAAGLPPVLELLSCQDECSDFLVQLAHPFNDY